MKNVLSFLLARLAERSTITTLVTLISGAVGVNFSPENANAIVTAVIGVVSAVAIFWGTDKPE